jgi:hypothetical protein
MSGSAQLPSELVWTAEGHLSEVAMTAIADGEEAILPREAFGHLGTCAVCAKGVEGAASLSAAIGQALAGPEPAPRPRAFPALAVGLSIALAALAAIPSIGPARVWIAQFYEVFLHALPVLVRSVAALSRGVWSVLPLMSLVAAMLLFLLGLSVARMAPRMIER